MIPNNTAMLHRLTTQVRYGILPSIQQKIEECNPNMP